MQLVLQDPAGGSFEAILLAISPYRLRIAMPELDDTTELVYTYGSWQMEDGRRMEIAAIVEDQQRSSEYYGSLAPFGAAAC